MQTLTCVIVLLALGARLAAVDPVFEVASIKQSRATEGGKGGVQVKGDQFRATHITLGVLIRYAHGQPLPDGQNVRLLEEYRVVDGPGWINTEHFNIEAVMPPGLRSAGDVSLMLRALLADRFKLRVRNETKEIPMYAMVRATPDARRAPGLRSPAAPCALTRAEVRDEIPPCGLSFRPGHIRADGTTMGALAVGLAPMLGRLIVDRTGLSGTFDFTLLYAPEEPAAADPAGTASTAGSIFTSLQEQLGLKLEAQTATADVLVIDAAERPTEN